MRFGVVFMRVGRYFLTQCAYLVQVQQSESEKDQLRKRIAELEMQKDKTQVEALSLQQKVREP